MKFGFRIGVCLVSVLTWQAMTAAQVADSREQLLNQALVQFKDDFEELTRSRGIEEPSSLRIESIRNEDLLFLNGSKPLSRFKDISRADLSKALTTFPERTAVLFYSFTGSTLRIWLVDKNGISAFHESDVTRVELEAAMTRLRSSLRVDLLQLDRTPHLRSSRRRRTRMTVGVSLRRSTNALSSILLPAAIGPQLSTIRHLIVAPVLGIGTVPFAMLQPFRDGTCLIDKMSVSVVPSVYDLLNHVDAWNAEFKTPIVIGNPYFPPSKKWEVPSLPGAEAEARYVANAVHVAPLIGKSATKQEVVTDAENADFLYFATHGIADSNDPLNGGFLLLSAGELEQGWWTAREIQGLKLKARLAVLSACQTGLGQIQDAGVIGLSRAFQIAGVPRVTMSLWSVDDKATSALMKSFVDYLHANVPSEALRLAMLDLKKQQPNPSKWGAFVLFGTPR